MCLTPCPSQDGERDRNAETGKREKKKKRTVRERKEDRERKTGKGEREKEKERRREVGEDLPLKLCVLLTSPLQHVGVSGRAVCDSYSYVRRVRVRRLSCCGVFLETPESVCCRFLCITEAKAAREKGRRGEERGREREEGDGEYRFTGVL